MSRVCLLTACCIVSSACQSPPQPFEPTAARAAVSEVQPVQFSMPGELARLPIANEVGPRLVSRDDPWVDPSSHAHPTTHASPPTASTTTQYPNLTQKFGLSLGVAAYSSFDTSIRVDSDTLVGAVVDLEETLGVDQSTSVGRLDGFYRFNPRHQVDFAYYDISRSGVRGIDEDIQVGEVVLPSGFEINTKFDTTIFKIDYRYNFVSDERTRIGASFGFHTLSFDTAFMTVSGTVEETFKAALPLPLLGLHFEYALSPKWMLLSTVEVLQVDLGAYSGFISDRRLTLEHNTFENFGWGFGYNGFTLDAEVEGEGRLSSKVNMEYQGLLLYLRWYF
jgi:hypothetical protein